MVQVFAGLHMDSAGRARGVSAKRDGDNRVRPGLQTVVAEHPVAMGQVHRRAIAGDMHGFLTLGTRADHHLCQRGLDRGKPRRPTRG